MYIEGHHEVDALLRVDDRVDRGGIGAVEARVARVLFRVAIGVEELWRRLLVVLGAFAQLLVWTILLLHSSRPCVFQLTEPAPFQAKSL